MSIDDYTRLVGLGFNANAVRLFMEPRNRPDWLNWYLENTRHLTKEEKKEQKRVINSKIERRGSLIKIDQGLKNCYEYVTEYCRANDISTEVVAKAMGLGRNFFMDTSKNREYIIYRSLKLFLNWDQWPSNYRAIIEEKLCK